MKFLLKILFLSLIFGSCGKFFDQVIDIDPPKYDKQMVLNCQAGSTDSVLKISISRNYGLLENIPVSLLNVSDAKVEWLEAGVVKYTFTRDTFNRDTFQNSGFQFKYYGKDLKTPFISPGKNYEIRVSHPDYQSISSMQTVPNLVKLDTVKLRLDTTVTPDGYFYGEAIFTITFQDPPGESNFYNISISGDDPYSYYSFETDDPNVETGIDYTKILMSDKNFDGKKYTLRLKTGDVYSEFYTIKFSSLTKEYYAFAKAVPRNEEADFNPFASPVQVPSNVAGGLGLFALFGTYEIVVFP